MGARDSWQPDNTTAGNPTYPQFDTDESGEIQICIALETVMRVSKGLGETFRVRDEDSREKYLYR
jgi:hypothetical protein